MWIRACWGGGGKQLHLLPRRTLPQLMISDDIIRQSAHKQMLEALPKQCQLSRFAFLWTYYLYRAFKFVMLITPSVSMQDVAQEELNCRELKCTSAPRRLIGGVKLTGVQMRLGTSGWRRARRSRVWSKITWAHTTTLPLSLFILINLDSTRKSSYFTHIGGQMQ